MITEAQYAAIGRAILSFNDIEYLLEVYTAHLLDAPEWSVSVLLAEQGQFRHKADRFDAILKAIQKERPAYSPVIQPVLEWIKRARGLADKRNQYAHALIVTNPLKKGTWLRIRKEDRICNEKELEEIAAETEDLADQLHNACGELLEKLDEVRGSK